MDYSFFSDDHVRVSLRDDELKANYANLRLMLRAMDTGQESAFFDDIYFEFDSSADRWFSRSDPPEGIFYSSTTYEEDGTAGSYEGSGAGANFRINHFAPVDPSQVNGFGSMDQDRYKLVPLTATVASTDSYWHCSCYGPEECVSFDEESDPRSALDLWIQSTGLDFVKTDLARSQGSEDVYLINTDEMCFESAELYALQEVFCCVDAIYVPVWFLRLGDPKVWGAIDTIQNWWKHSIYWNPRHHVCIKRVNREFDGYEAGPPD